MLTLHTPLRLLQHIPALRTPAAAADTTLYVLRAGQLVHIGAAPGSDGRWAGWPLGGGHGPDCRVILDDVDLATAVPPAWLTVAGYPDPECHPAGYRVAWCSSIWQQHGARRGQAARQLAIAAYPSMPQTGTPAPWFEVRHGLHGYALADHGSIRRYALAAHMHPVGFGRHVTALLKAGWLLQASIAGEEVFRLTFPRAADGPEAAAHMPALIGRA
ncbi:hypothetical protein [Dactylosporangium salmoneum]|uniref:Uncharacterized protein n=1 Tax=Dactylosporangium salmoneum TaxID=53361 RepID=A0ABP5SZM3_9ACTN